MNTIYEDDAKVGELTRLAFWKTGSRLLQIHRFAETDEEHAERLLQIFDPPHGCTIADVGCGVGRLAELMHAKRPDLWFYLINPSQQQLGMCPWFDLFHGTAEELPINKADAIMVTYVLGHIDIGKFVTECVRVRAKHIYIYDLFKRDPFCDCRLHDDLNYVEWTIDQVIEQFYDIAGFIVTKRAITTFVPENIARILPSPETLNNTVSAALVFER